MNVVDKLNHELNELNGLEEKLNKRLEQLNPVDCIDWTPEESKQYDGLTSLSEAIWARQLLLTDELDKAFKRQKNQRKAWYKTHPTMANIWPKGA